jgi:hypothetical protein
MKRISSSQTFFMKKIFPVIWFCVIAVIFTTALTQGALARNPAVLVLPVVLLLTGIFVYRKAIWDLADEVYDGGDFLTVRKGSEEVTISLANIINVSGSRSSACSGFSPRSSTIRVCSMGKPRRSCHACAVADDER